MLLSLTQRSAVSGSDDVFPNPRLLLHPNIPKPLHGLAPRTIMGVELWNKLRHEAYSLHDDRCYACGVHKKDAIYRNSLEAHEDYHVDYERGKMEIRSIVALCHVCHNFIHNGRLMAMAMKSDPQMPLRKAWHVLYSGFKVLKAGECPPNPFALRVAVELYNFNVNERSGDSPPKWADPTILEPLVGKYHLPDNMESVEWGAWRLVFDGKEYEPLRGTAEDWMKYYNPEWSDEWRRGRGGESFE